MCGMSTPGTARFAFRFFAGTFAGEGDTAESIRVRIWHSGTSRLAFANNRDRIHGTAPNLLQQVRYLALRLGEHLVQFYCLLVHLNSAFVAQLTVRTMRSVIPPNSSQAVRRAPAPSLSPASESA